MDYVKKAINFAIRTDKIEEFVNQIKIFIEKVKEELFNKQDDNNYNSSMHISNLLHVQHKGRQPNRYK